MTEKKDTKTLKLSGLGQQLEKTLISLLKELDAKDTVSLPDGKTESRPRYSLLDRLRVMDRALKLEGIKHKITDDEGSFFGNKGGGDDDGSD